MPPTTSDYLKPYHDAHRRHGPGFDATLWASPQTQQVRFDVLIAHGQLAGRHLLDAGCSRGDLAAYLLQRQVSLKHYTGIDALDAMVQHARARKLPGCDFHTGDLVTHPDLMKTIRADVIFFSGTLNTMQQPMAEQLLDAAWEATGESLIFNFLSDTCGPDAPQQLLPARRFDTLRLVRWALARTPAVLWRQDYMPHGHDATIVMRKGV